MGVNLQFHSTFLWGRLDIGTRCGGVFLSFFSALKLLLLCTVWQEFVYLYVSEYS